MKKLYTNFILILLLTGCASSHQKLYNEKPAFYSYIIGDTKTNKIYEEYAADVYATPASCQKTITALVALKSLGSDYRYENKLFVTKKNRTIYDIVISFSGDPTFTSENLLDLLKPLSGTKIHGTIILDASIFKTTPHSTNIIIWDMGTSYGQPVSSINIDKNLIFVKITPTKIGKIANITNDSSYKIESNIVTNSENSSIKLLWDGETIKADGNINIKDTFLERKISPIKIDPYILHKVNNALKSLNIKGRIKIIHDKNKLPNNLVFLNETKSATLKEFIIPALKKSDNLVFDALYLKIIHSNNDKPITDWSDGDQIMKKLIKEYFSIDMNDALFIDGSGLSRLNRIQPRKLLDLLRQGFLIPEFVEALSAPRETKSTLENRNNLPSNVKAKTGSLSGISCLCGYNVNTNKSRVFVIMANSFAPPAKELLDVIDKFVGKQVGE